MSYNSKEKMYLHINNGGITFDIESDSFNGLKSRVSPLLVVEAKHFGFQTNQMKIPMRAECLKSLGEYLIEQSKLFEEYPEYVEADIKEPLTGSRIERWEKDK